MTRYVAYNLLLEKHGKQIAYIDSQPILRYLGKLSYKDLKDDDMRQIVNQKLLSMLNINEKSQLTEIMQMWIYNNATIPKITWEVTIYNFPMTYIQNLEASCTKYLKKWAGISKYTNNSALYRSRRRFGLQLKRPSTSVKCMQVTKYHLNKHSKDGKTQTLYESV